MKGKLLWIVGIIGGIFLLAILWSLLSSPGSDSGTEGKQKRVGRVAKDPCLERGGSSQKTYNLFFENKAGEGLTVEEMRFQGLDTRRASVSVLLRYEGARPVWAEKRSSFRVTQPGRSAPPQFTLVGPVGKISGESAFRQKLSGLFVNPEDIGINNPGEEPVYPLFLEIRGFIPKESLSVGIIAPADCPVGLASQTSAGIPKSNPKKQQIQKQKAKQKVKKKQQKVKRKAKQKSKAKKKQKQG